MLKYVWLLLMKSEGLLKRWVILCFDGKMPALQPDVLLLPFADTSFPLSIL